MLGLRCLGFSLRSANNRQHKRMNYDEITEIPMKIHEINGIYAILLENWQKSAFFINQYFDCETNDYCQFFMCPSAEQASGLSESHCFFIICFCVYVCKNAAVLFKCF